MEQNITLYIGDSASGKTRILKQLINKAVSEGHKPVTNMKRYYDANYVPDKNKKSAIIEANTDLTERIVENEIIETDYDSYLSDILRLLYSKGDILILDEIDAMLKTQDIIDLASVLSDTRGLWNKIYINGYAIELLRLFTDIDREDYTETYNENIYLVTNGIARKLSEDEFSDAFNNIRN